MYDPEVYIINRKLYTMTAATDQSLGVITETADDEDGESESDDLD